MNIAYVNGDSNAFDQANGDNYAYEEQQEREALLRGMHPAMKTWYNSPEAAFLKEKYGEFPLFWRELETWEHHKVIRKIYLISEDKRLGNEPVDLPSIEQSLLENFQAPTVAADAPEPSQQQPLKKRRNRWGDAPAPQAPTEAPLPPNDAPAPLPEDTPASGEEEGKKKRKSRWSQPAETPLPTTTPGGFPMGMGIGMGIGAPQVVVTQEKIQQTLVLQMQLKQCNDKLQSVVQDAKLRELDPRRSPSPPPQYDGQGKRVNTREVRMREALQRERTTLIEEMMRINPYFKPPADFVRAKPSRKLYIPYRTHPQYNFIGLIIGPRGNTQKRMEQETGCKISIRGKGSVKEGSKGRAGKALDDDDELHVYVQGDSEDAVERAAKMVQELLVPVDDEKNEHKQKQLRELALINGTLREDEFCHVCGEKGHRQYECPHRVKTYKAAGVKCAICGDSSHPTRDCPMKQSEPTNDAAIDKEYMSFMAELGDESAGPVEHGQAAAAATESKSISLPPGSNVSYAPPIPAPAPVQQTITYATAPAAWANPQAGYQAQYQAAWPGYYGYPQQYYPPQAASYVPPAAAYAPDAYAAMYAQTPADYGAPPPPPPPPPAANYPPPPPPPPN